MPRSDGSTLRSHLEAVERQTGKTPERLMVEPIPVEYGWHWHTWISLHSGRSYGAMGATPLTWLDIDAWARMMRVRLTELDLLVIRVIDSSWFVAQAAERDRQDKVRDKEAAKAAPPRRQR
jgi:hypothetical protein